MIPVSLNKSTNLIIRVILPFISQDNIYLPTEITQTGLGDAVVSFFLSPKDSKIIWGAGPVFSVPTASDVLLGSEKWGAGPTVVVLNQNGPWTVGMLANHIWSVAGDENRADVSATFFQPFVSHTNKKQFSIGLSGENTYDWSADNFIGSVMLNVTQVTVAGGLPLSLGISAKYYFSGNGSTPAWGGRSVITFIFPKKSK